ncbi:MAG: hypothetical protein ACYC6A_00665 [Armatimonadota bacterium]
MGGVELSPKMKPEALRAEALRVIGELQREAGRLQALTESQARILARRNAEVAEKDRIILELNAHITEQAAAIRLQRKAGVDASPEVEAWETFGLKIALDLVELLERLHAVRAAGTVAAPETPAPTPEPAAAPAPSPPAEKAARRCSITWCEAKHSSRGWCFRHYQLWRIHGDPLLSLRRVPGQNAPVLMRETGPKQYARVEEVL